MMITAARPQFVRSAQPQPPAPPAPQDPAEHFSAGRTASSVVGGTLLGAGMGYLGMQGGGVAGLLIGMETTPASASLGGFFLHSLRGAAIGQVVGGAVYGALGVAVGAMGASWLYDKATSN